MKKRGGKMKMQLNKDSLYARSLLLPVTKGTRLVLIGCGGTGSWLAPHVARTARLLREVRDQQVSVVFCDHDHVEEKNIFRQNFCEGEIGRNKAVSLAQRYGHAWGIPIAAIDQRFSRTIATKNDFAPSYNDQQTTVFITCVDNNSARREVAKMCESWPIWWIDTGNLKTAGQVSVGRELFEKELSPLRLPSVTTWAPPPSLQFPKIMRDTSEEVQSADYANMSCAELALVDEQGISINHSIASVAASLLAKMLVTKDLHYHCAYVSLDAGTQFVYNSTRILRKQLKMAKATSPLFTADDEEL
jgi:PRTRC genetic system ThiF family protein